MRPGVVKNDLPDSQVLQAGQQGLAMSQRAVKGWQRSAPRWQSQSRRSCSTNRRWAHQLADARFIGVARHEGYTRRIKGADKRTQHEALEAAMGVSSGAKKAGLRLTEVGQKTQKLPQDFPKNPL